LNSYQLACGFAWVWLACVAKSFYTISPGIEYNERATDGRHNLFKQQNVSAYVEKFGFTQRAGNVDGED